MPENEKSSEVDAELEPTPESEPTESEDLEPHGIEVEDDSEAGCLDVNCGCA